MGQLGIYLLGGKVRFLPMRIAVVHSFYASKVPSGENVVVQAQVEELLKAGHEVQLFDAHTDDLAKNRLYKVATALNVAVGRGLDPGAGLAEFRPDVVHVHNLFPNFATNWLRDCPFPLVVTVHNFRAMCAAGTLFRNGASCTKCPDHGQYHSVVNACYKASRLATLPLAIRNNGGVRKDAVLSRADAHIFLSNRSLQTYVQYGLPAQQSSVVPNFVRHVVAPSQGSSNAWLYAGRLTEEKGIIDLLQHWPRSASLKVLGDGPLMDEARSIAGSNVHFHGAVSHGEVLRELTTAVGLVLPSKWAEGLPTIYLEALAAGLPVVTRDGNSAADDISLYRHGAVYTNASELPDALEYVQANWVAISQRADERYTAAYTPRAWIVGVMRTYQQAIERRKAPGAARNR